MGDNNGYPAFEQIHPGRKSYGVTPMACQSHFVDIDKQEPTARWVRSKHRDDVPEHQKHVVLSLYDTPTIAALAHDLTAFG